MGRYSERWFSQFSEEWQDLTTLRGFLGGVLSLVLNGAVFGLLLLLAVLLERISLSFAVPSAIQFVLIVALSAVGGGGWLYLFQESDRIKQWMQTFAGRLLATLVLYGGFWLLVLYNATFGMGTAVAYLVGRGAVLLGIFIGNRR